MSEQVVTRFAPSPTGSLHVGGARTALFAWAFARRHEGRFVLRIEDTDRRRSSREAVAGLIGDLHWLGLDWDEGPAPEGEGEIGGRGPYFQSDRAARGLYEAHYRALLDAGRAYERDGALYFRMPEEAITTPDAVLGEVTTPAEKLEDFVVRKADGMPTYHFAVVVDDAAMGVTHVLRGQEHLANTPRHLALQRALGLREPVYAHVPAILNPDGSKMSKRDKAKAAREAFAASGRSRDELVERCAASWLHRAIDETADASAPDRAALAGLLDGENDHVVAAELILIELDARPPEIEVADFRRHGYLPATLCNYLALLGWTPPEKDRERFDLAYLRGHFGLEGIGRANARFDREKLAAFNGEDLQAMPLGRFRELLGAHLRSRHPRFESLAEDAERFAVFAEVYQPRSRTLSDPARDGAFFVVEDDALDYDPKAVRKVLERNEGAGDAVLGDLLERLDEGHCPDWDRASIEAALERYAEEAGVGFGKVAQPLRVAVTGSTVSPPIDATLFILGRSSVQRRIRRCLDRAAQGAPEAR